MEGIIEEEEEEDEDDEGGVSVNKRKKEDDTEVGNFLLCFSTCLHGTSLAHGYPKDSDINESNSTGSFILGLSFFFLASSH